MRTLSLAALLCAGMLTYAGHASAGSYQTLYTFQGGTDGAVPEARLLYSNGLLYGTTSQGGAPYNLGTLFQITPGGSETVLARFPGGDLGATPLAGLTQLGGVFYGTTERGGAPICYADSAYGCGVVYSFTPAAGLAPLHVFRGIYTDGALPAADLTVVNGVLFGTTKAGGAAGSSSDGTLFKLAPGGRERLLFTFYPNVGGQPLGGLTADKGRLYGTLSAFGPNVGGQLYSTDAKGNVTFPFSLPTSFDRPVGNLVSVHGQLYGVTVAGGYKNCGEIYKLNSVNNNIEILYNFAELYYGDGCGPSAGLTYLNGNLFGTTSQGGAYNAGTIFVLHADGTEQILHSFGNKADGAHPAAALVPIGNTLYGTTQDGGVWDAGTVFSIAP